MKEPKLDAGTEIRFTTGRLTSIDPKTGQWTEGMVEEGDTGVIVAGELEPLNYTEGYNLALVDWFFVRPDKYLERIIPVHRTMVEALVKTGAVS
jgi:hypothetical protein